jgi:hypothetical protein
MLGLPRVLKYNRMIRRTLILGLLLMNACSGNELTFEQFEKLPPFKGQIIKLEKIGNERPPTSISGPDYRVTVRKSDGTIIVLKRIETSLGTAMRLEKLLEQKNCDLPDDVANCAYRAGTKF